MVNSKLLVSSLLAGSMFMPSAATAVDNPFQMDMLSPSYQIAAAEKSTEGKCGEGKCGATATKKDSKTRNPGR